MSDSRLIEKIRQDFGAIVAPEKEFEVAQALGNTNNVFLKVLQADLNYQEDLMAYTHRMVEIAAAINERERNEQEQELLERFAKDQRLAAEFLVALMENAEEVEEKKMLAAKAEADVFDPNKLVDEIIQKNEEIRQIEKAIEMLPTSFDQKAWADLRTQVTKTIEVIADAGLVDENGNKVVELSKAQKEQLQKNCAPLSPEELARINPQAMGGFTHPEDLEGRAKALAACGSVKQQLELFNAFAEAKAASSGTKIEPKLKEEMVNGRRVVHITAGRVAALRDINELMKLRRNKEAVEHLCSDKTVGEYGTLTLQAFAPEIRKNLEAKKEQLSQEIESLAKKVEDSQAEYKAEDGHIPDAPALDEPAPASPRSKMGGS
jgi:chaperonin cofactor prefoldin